MNMTFILALLPTGLAGAVAHSFGERNVELNAAFGPLHPLLETLVVEMGVNAGVLWLFGILGTLALGMGTGLLVEYACQLLMRQPYHATNGHGVLMGMMMALLAPPSVPWWVLVLGVGVAIFLGKQIFGGIGGYPMHPAMVGWLILLLSWPHHLYPLGSASIAAPHVAAVVTTLLGGIVLWLTGYIRWQIPAGVLAGTALAALLFRNALGGTFLDQFLTGHVVLAAFFIATDSTCSPANRLASLLHGLFTGFLIVLIRAYGIWPDAVPFAVILVNVLHPLLDRIRPRVRTAVA
jgi:electron transport complex protein RnfD